MRTFLKLVVWLTLIVGGIGWLLLATCMGFWKVPSDDALLSLSIMPTLEAGDTVLLWRAGLPGFGELVRCPDPEAPRRYVVGRILGEQGDRISVDLGTITVNNRLIASQRACSPAELSVFDPQTGQRLALRCDIEQAGGVEYTRARDIEPPAQSTAPFQVRVPDGQVFMASDNRHYHDDTRDFGTLSKDACRERIVFRLWGARGWFDQKRRLMFIN